MDFDQNKQTLKFAGSLEDLFDALYAKYDHDQIFLMDSAGGPSVDRQRDIIGLFPQVDILLKGEQLFIETIDSTLKQAIHDQLDPFYKTVDNYYVLPESQRFSDVFQKLKKVFVPKKSITSFTNGLVGYFGYEYLHHIEKISTGSVTKADLPDVHLSYYSSIIHFKESTGELEVFGNEINSSVQEQHLGLLELLNNLKVGKAEPSFNFDREADASSDKFTIMETKPDYLKKVAKAKQYINDGDIFQVQLGFRFITKMNLDTAQAYKALRESSPSPYMFLWSRNNVSLIGNSPELQLKIQNGEIVIRPIAGTSKGKGTPETRETIINNLSQSTKERAEHVMLVDLARNDIGRVSKIGTVKVQKLMDIEEYSNVFHMTSTVTSELLPDVDSMVAFEDTFPAGTLSGAPKIRAMEIIQELESYERGPYGGAFGFFDFNGDLISSITIRTIVVNKDQVFFQASAGIVADSVPESEWNEVFLKTQTLRRILNSIDDPAFNLKLKSDSSN